MVQKTNEPPQRHRRPSQYQMLADRLRDEIRRGHYADGTQLPTEAELASSNGVSRQTVRRAFHDLVAEGTVYRVPGRGTFATSPGQGYLRQFGSVEDLVGPLADNTMELLDPLTAYIDVAAAGRLQLPSDQLWRVVFRRLLDDKPFSHTTTFMPPEVGELMTTTEQLTVPRARGTGAITQMIDSRLDSPIAEVQQSITVEQAEVQLANDLNCEAGHPLLRIDRTFFDNDGKPVSLAVSRFLPELYSYQLRLRRSIN